MARRLTTLIHAGAGQPCCARWYHLLRHLVRASLAITMLLASAPAVAQSDQPGFAMQALYHDQSAPLTLLVAAALAQPSGKPNWQGPPMRTVTPAMRAVAPAAAMSVTDLGAGSSLPAPPVAADTLLDVPGLAANGSAPANVSAAAGAGQIVQRVGAQLAIYRQSDGALLLGPVEGNVLFRDFGGPDACRLSRRGTPQVLFDAMAQRWIFSQVAWNDGDSVNGPYFICIAVSASADASGAYARYAYPARNAGGQTVFPDDPALAIWPDAYYLSVVTFKGRLGNYQGPQVCGFDRHAMLAGADAQARCRDLPLHVGPVLAASVEGTSAPPAQAPNYLMGLQLDAAGNGQTVLLWRYSFASGSLSPPQVLPVAPFTMACPATYGGPCIIQPAPGELLEAHSDRLMARLVYWAGAQGAMLLANHTVQLERPGGGQAGLRWYAWRIEGDTVTLVHQESFAPDGDSRFMGSIGIDRQGGIVLSYSVSGPATYPGLRYSAGTAETGLMGEGVITNGSGVQVDSGGLWAARSAMVQDGSDSCLLWASGPFIAVTGANTWRTQIAGLRFARCH